MKSYTFLVLSDRIAIKADSYQWMICKRKGNRWIPKTYHLTLRDALERVQDIHLRNTEANSAEKLIEAINQHNEHLAEIVGKAVLTREITR